MVYLEQFRDLFSVDDKYYLAHCISADFRLGAGIAVEFNRRFNMRTKLNISNPGYINYYITGSCLKEGRVLNLVTKKFFYNKPTYISLQNALVHMKKICIRDNIKYIAMPTIGCGLDRLKWDKVSKMICDIFSNTDIEILVCLNR